ncbi:MAG: MmcQ/YjbR family DNA-binding protein [Acidobacteriota bacterium]
MTSAAWKKHVERVRRICMAFPGATEKLSHGEPTFFTPKRVFAMLSSDHHGDGHWAVTLPAGPGVQEALIAERPEAYYYPPYVGKGGWVGVDLRHVSDDELGGLIHESWKLIGQKSKPAAKRVKAGAARRA